MEERNKQEPHIKKCLLDDGRVMEYDVCAHSPNFFEHSPYKYIGDGVIIEYDGYPQSSSYRFCFFVRR